MANWFTGDIVANGIKIHYHRTGGDKPPLVLSHGTTDCSLTWTRTARALEQDYDVIMYDRHGHGFSDAPESGYSFADHAADLTALIAALHLEHPRVIGHSGGVATAAIVAADHPDLLACVILEDPPWGSGWGGWEQTIAGLRQWFLDVSSKTREELMTKASESKWSEEDFIFWVEGHLQMSPNVIQEFEQPEPLWRDFMSKITCPILLITSDLEMGPLNTAEDVQEIASLWHDGKAVRINGAGHTIHSDQFQEFILAVRAFLAEIEARV